MNRRGLMIAALLLGAAWAAPAAGQTVEETGARHGDWQEACEADPPQGEVCFIFQRLRLDGRVAANLTVGYKPPAFGPVAVVNMPLGAVLLPEGLRFETDQDVDGWAPFRFCDRRGCHVETEIEPKLLDAMQRGLEAWLVVRDLNGRQLRLPFSLRGFTAGLHALRR